MSYRGQTATNNCHVSSFVTSGIPLLKVKNKYFGKEPEIPHASCCVKDSLICLPFRTNITAVLTQMAYDSGSELTHMTGN